jgi:hypothetical protein
MSNTGFGLRLVGRVGGGEPKINTYAVPATDSTALYQGDVVMIPTSTTGTMDTTYGVPTCTIAVSGDVLLGVIVGFKPSASLPYTGQYRAASTLRYVQVCDDQDAIYEVQEDGLTSRVTAAHIGEMFNIPLNVGTGSTVTGLSGTMITSNSATQSASDCKIIGVRRDVANIGAVAGSVGAILLVKLNVVAKQSTSSVG